MEKLLFREEQRFSQWWLWTLLLSVFAVAVGPLWYGLIFQLSTGNPWGTNPAGDGVLAVTTVFVTLVMGVILWLFLAMRLQIEINTGGLRFRYLPLVRKWRNIRREEIMRFEVGTYRPVAEYGGWGIRGGKGKYGKAFNVSGNVGLKLFLSNGKFLLLGTQRSQAMLAAMKKMMTPETVSRF